MGRNNVDPLAVATMYGEVRWLRPSRLKKKPGCVKAKGPRDLFCTDRECFSIERKAAVSAFVHSTNEMALGPAWQRGCSGPGGRVLQRVRQPVAEITRGFVGDALELQHLRQGVPD